MRDVRTGEHLDRRVVVGKIEVVDEKKAHQPGIDTAAVDLVLWVVMV